MIHQLLMLERPLFVLDTETTGTDTATDRIIEIGFQQWDAEKPCEACERTGRFVSGKGSDIQRCETCKGTGKLGGLTKEWRSLVNPGVPIPLASSKVHHITNKDFERCRKCDVELDNHPIGKASETIAAACIDPTPWPTFKQLAPNLSKGFTNCDYAGKNVRFDLRILAAEFKRAKVEWNYTGARIIDAERLEQLAVPRSLSHLHEKYVGRKHDGAHGALSDVRASTTVIVKQLETHTQLPRSLAALHEAQWPGWLCDSGQFTMVNGVATCQFGKWRGKAMKDIQPSYWDWILGADFPADVKALASAAKLGKYPETK